MVIRHSTHAYSPMSFHAGSIGDHFPLLPTAAGRAYLAFCPSDECEFLLDELSSRQDAQGELARDTRRVRRMLEETRERGYAVNDGSWALHPRFGGLAAPIRKSTRVLACVNIVFSKRATSLAVAMRRYGGQLVEAAAEIERSLPAA